MDKRNSENNTNELNMTEEQIENISKVEEDPKITDDSTESLNEKIHQEKIIETYKKQGKKIDEDFLNALSSTAWTYRRARTTNQEYGLWTEDPYLKDKDWYRVRRYPLRSSFSTRFQDAINTGISR